MSYKHYIPLGGVKTACKLPLGALDWTRSKFRVTCPQCKSALAGRA